MYKYNTKYSFLHLTIIIKVPIAMTPIGAATINKSSPSPIPHSNMPDIGSTYIYDSNKLCQIN